jgi:membrane protease YdiL (CAAX protease family)
MGVNPGTVSSVASPRRIDWASVVMFVVLAFALSWAAFIGLRAIGVPFAIRSGIGMFGPLVAAVITRVVRGEGSADFGLRASGRRGRSSYAYAYLLPIALFGAGVLLAVVIGYQHFALLQRWQQEVDALARTLPPGRQDRLRSMSGLVLAIQFLGAFTYGPVINCFVTLGEEFGWRGHLLPRLAPLGGPLAAIVVGAVWTVWHAPLIALDGYEFGIRSWAVVPLFGLFVVPLSVITAWLRFRSGSVWPGVLLHATINAQAGLALLLLSAPGSPLIGPPVGVIGCVPLWIVAIWLVATGRVRARAST